MILPGKPILALVTQLVEFVAPFARKVKPGSRRIRRVGGCTQDVGFVIVGVGVGVEGGIPEWATVGGVVQDAKGEDITVLAGGGVHGVGPGSRVDDRLRSFLVMLQFAVRKWRAYPFPYFLNGIIAICSAKIVFT